MNDASGGDVLIVDDTPANLQVLWALLKDEGYRVRPVPNGRLALKAAEQTVPDLVLLDINMPDMNGYETCEALKSNPDTAGVPVIFLSALTDAEDKQRAYEAGGVDFVTKPFQFEEVKARVHMHLKVARLERALADCTCGAAPVAGADAAG